MSEFDSNDNKDPFSIEGDAFNKLKDINEPHLELEDALEEAMGALHMLHASHKNIYSSED